MDDMSDGRNVRYSKTSQVSFRSMEYSVYSRPNFSSSINASGNEYINYDNDRAPDKQKWILREIRRKKNHNLLQDKIILDQYQNNKQFRAGVKTIGTRKLPNFNDPANEYESDACITLADVLH